MTRALKWLNLVTASLVVVGVFAQVYFIAVYIYGADADALDLHTGVGNAVHGFEILAFLSAIGAYWKRWGEMSLSLALVVLGTVQIGFAQADNAWAAGFHGLLAMFVLVLASIISHRAVHALGLGRHAAS